jgi:DNA-nicking Smr family endonuclease
MGRRPDQRSHRRGLLDPDDQRAWEEEMRGVRPAPPMRGRIPPPRRGRRSAAAEAPPADAGAPFDRDDGALTGRATDLDQRTLRALRAGRIRPEGRLDLHGMTRDEARAAVTGFVGGASQRGLRCVLLVTGRGTPSAGTGVLRRSVPDWLTQEPLVAAVRAWSPATGRDGGEGAFYVLLRRS